MTSLGRKIWEYRKNRGLTQDELGEQVQVDGRQISRYENDKVRPSKRVLRRLCDYFEVALDDLMSEEDASPEHEIRDHELYRQFVALDQMENKEKEALKVIIGAVLAKERAQRIFQEASSF